MSKLKFGSKIYNDNVFIIKGLDQEAFEKSKLNKVDHFSKSIERSRDMIGVDLAIPGPGFYDQFFPFDKKYTDEYILVSYKFHLNAHNPGDVIKVLSTINEIIVVTGEKAKQSIAFTNGLVVNFVVNRNKRDEVLNWLHKATEEYSEVSITEITEYYKDGNYLKL